MSFALTRKKWAYIDGLGRVEVLGNGFLDRDAEPKVKKARAKKVETMDFKTFMRGDATVLSKPKLKMSSLPLIPLALAPLITPVRAFAQEAAKDPSMQSKMMTAFEPIIDLVQSLAYPVALLVVLGGGLIVIIGNSEKGFSMIQRAGLGYVLVMMLPMLLDVLVDAMKSVV